MKDKIFRMRLDDEYAARLDREASEEGMSKADLVRKRLGWPLVDRGPQKTRPTFTEQTAPAAPVDAERQPGLAAIQEIQRKLKGS
jgi:hypothetical protein